MRICRNAFFLLPLLAFLFPNNARAQYFIDTTLTLPLQSFRGKVTPIALSTAREDVKAIGMGRTQIGQTRTRPGMLANPAFLATPRNAVDVLNVQAGIPGRTLTATDFITSNTLQFQQGIFLQEIRQGIVDFDNAVTPDQFLAAIRRMNGGLHFISQLVNDISGGQEDPLTHGLRILPAMQAQVGHFGFTLSATAQTGFQVASGQVLDQLRNFSVPEDLSDPTAVAHAVQTLLLAVDGLFDENGNLAPDALPAVYALSFVDIAGTAGYGMRIAPNLDAGINLKIMNRRFSTSRIPAQNLNDLLSETRSNLETSTTGITADVGLLYTLPQSGTRLALTAENVIPMTTIESSMKINSVYTGVIGYARTSYPNGPIKIQGTDTGLVAARVPVRFDIPFELQAPLVVTIGGQHSLSNNLDAAFEWTDVATQIRLYSGFIERIRIGSEYRLAPLGEDLGFAFRLGFAHDHMTYGLGIDAFHIVQLDGAIAFDKFTDATTYYAQLRIGW